MKLSSAILFFVLTYSFTANAASNAQACLSGDDDPALKVKAANGITLVVCGFEDREVKSPAGKRAFADFTIYAQIPNVKDAQKVFESGASETYWVKAVEGKGLELEELWFFSEQPKAALWQEVVCEPTSCKLATPKCVFKMKKNTFPKALGSFEKLHASNRLDEDGEELLDQIWAQALTGDEKSQKFYETEPTGLSGALIEVYKSNKDKLKELQTLKCK